EGRPGTFAVRVDRVALSEIAGPAVRAKAAGDGRWNHHPVARLEIAHHVAELLDDPDSFVPENRSRLHAGHRAANHVQVRAANGRCREPYDGVGGLQDPWLRHLFEPDITDAVEYDCFHGSTSSRRDRRRAL